MSQGAVPSYCERYPKGRDRLLALAEVSKPLSEQTLALLQAQHCQTVASSVTSHSSSSGASSASSTGSKQPIPGSAAHRPRMGLRDPGGANRCRDSSGNRSTDRSGPATTTITTDKNIIPEKLLEHVNSGGCATSIISGLKAIGSRHRGHAPSDSSSQNQKNMMYHDSAVIRDVGAGFSYWAPSTPNSKTVGIAPIVTPSNASAGLFSKSTELLVSSTEASPNNALSSQMRTTKGRSRGMYQRNARQTVKSEALNLEQLKKLYGSMPDCSGSSSELEPQYVNGGSPPNDLPPPLPLSNIPRQRSSLTTDDTSYANIDELQLQLSAMYNSGHRQQAQLGHDLQFNGSRHHNQRNYVPSPAPGTSLDLQRDCCSPSADSGYRSVPRSLDDAEAACLQKSKSSGSPKNRSPLITTTGTANMVNSGQLHGRAPPPYERSAIKMASSSNLLAAFNNRQLLNNEKSNNNSNNGNDTNVVLKQSNNTSSPSSSIYSNLPPLPSSAQNNLSKQHKRRGSSSAEPCINTATPGSAGGTRISSSKSLLPSQSNDCHQMTPTVSALPTSILVNPSSSSEEINIAGSRSPSYCSDLSSPSCYSARSSGADSGSDALRLCSKAVDKHQPSRHFQNQNNKNAKLNVNENGNFSSPAVLVQKHQNNDNSNGGGVGRTKQVNGSFDTISTNLSLADEFSLERCPKLIELERLPWNGKDVVTVLQRGRSKDLVNYIAVDVVPRLTYLLQRPLIRISREAHRLSQKHGKCSKHDVQCATKIILPVPIVDGCTKAGLGASAMYMMCCENLRLSKSHSAGLRFCVGKFHRWMTDYQISVCVHEHAAVFLTAVMEYLLEEIVLQSMPSGSNSVEMLTAESLDLALANNVELWGLVQPYQHLICGRTANVPTHQNNSKNRKQEKVRTNGTIVRNLEQSLLATCVGSIDELEELIGLVLQQRLKGSVGSNLNSTSTQQKHQPSWNRDAINTLFYYMRCTQLEHAENLMNMPCLSLGGERPYMVLPPLVEWLRVSTGFCEHRCGLVVDADDVVQSARVLLPGMDCAPRSVFSGESSVHNGGLSAQSCATKMKMDIAFQMLSCGRNDLVPQALLLLGPQKLDALNNNGLSMLMLACIKGDEAAVRTYLDAGANANLAVPHAPTPNCDAPLYDLGGWTALTFAVAHRHVSLIQYLIDSGADVESQNMCTETPLQIAAMMGHHELVNLLLFNGADPYFSTRTQEIGIKKRGCPCPIVLAAAHGHRTSLQLMLAKRRSGKADEVLSLEDFLAEGSKSPKRRSAECSESDEGGSQISIQKLSKAQLKTLQEALYHAAESGHIDITMDLRNLGIQWTTHIWTQTLASAQELRRKALIQLLLADFIQCELDDFSQDFIDDSLPLLFDILRHAKNDVTATQVTEVLSHLYGEEPIPPIRIPEAQNVPRIDAKYVNNPDMSDVQFQLEGTLFYGHKIVLVNASEKFKDLLNNYGDSVDKSPIVIDGVKLETFQAVMEYLYSGKLATNEIDMYKLSEILHVSNRFSLNVLKYMCQSIIARQLNVDNCIDVYKWAKNSEAKSLVNYCEGFFLQNLSQLTKTCEVFRKSIYSSSKSCSYDIIDGLLTTLAARLHQRITRK